jgi:hypothetical protein
MTKPPKVPTKTTDETETPSLPVIRPVAGKLGLIVELLRRPNGADLSDMMEATGWQQHSVRGALAGALKKHRGLTIISEKIDGPRRYRLVEPPMQDVEPAQAKTPRSTSKAAKAEAVDVGA